MKPLYVKESDGEIEITVVHRDGSKTVLVKDETLGGYMNEPDYKKLQIELQEKYGFLFRKRVNNVINK